MPSVLSIRQIGLEFADLASRRPLTIPETTLPRASCIHQSEILKYIAVKIGKLNEGERLEEDYPMRMAMGNMWEEFYFSLREDYMWQPGEQIHDGIAMNCDGIGIIPDALDDEDWAVVVETKCTECKVVNTTEDLLEKFTRNWWVYQHQGRAYCYGYGPRVVIWPMLHYRGDWKGSGPVAMEYVVEFSDKEVDETWAMLKRYKAEIETLRTNGAR